MTAKVSPERGNLIVLHERVTGGPDGRGGVGAVRSRPRDVPRALLRQRRPGDTRSSWSETELQLIVSSPVRRKKVTTDGLGGWPVSWEGRGRVRAWSAVPSPQGRGGRGANTPGPRAQTNSEFTYGYPQVFFLSLNL